MKRILSVVCLVVALAGLVVFPAAVYAGPLVEVIGTLTSGPPTILEVRQVGGNTIVKYAHGGAFAGAIAGPITFEGTRIMHSNGPFLMNIEGIVVVSPATVDGKTGTLTMRLTGKAERTTPPAVALNWVIVSGTGELANLHGQGTYSGLAGVAGTYSGQLHFDPQ